MSLTIEPFAEDCRDAAVDILIARERARAGHEPGSPQRFHDPAVAREAIAGVYREERLDGIVARRDGRLAGFMLGARQLPAPHDGVSNFLHPRSVTIVEAGYAAQPGDAVDTYRELYAALAGAWVLDGYFAHYVDVFISDEEALEAWLSLGFARTMVRGMRDTGPVETSAQSAVYEIHQAGDEDLDLIVALEVANLRYHTSAPIFQAYFTETEAHGRGQEQEQLADPDNPRFLAYRERRPVGLMSFRPWRGRPGVSRPTVHLQHGFTTAEARGGGIGAALLDRGMAWARENGFERCTVNWLSANLLGARFWQSHGFRPVSYRLVRQIDERIAWARTRGDSSDMS
jgi:GNAT superfamily N-acetyltransferase